MKSNRRFTFIDYNILRKVKLKSLDTLSERIYIFAGSEHHSIPIKFVRKLQGLKCEIRWIIANNEGTEHVNFHIAFFMGKIHEKVDRKIEFVVVSNDPKIDSMISCVADQGRTCTRVQKSNTASSANIKDQISIPTTEAKTDETKLPFDLDNNTESLKDKTIKETIRRLMYSSNPPATVDELKAYIKRSNQEIAQYLILEDIVEEMIRRNEIRVDNGKIIYNFLPA